MGILYLIIYLFSKYPVFILMSSDHGYKNVKGAYLILFRSMYFVFKYLCICTCVFFLYSCIFLSSISAVLILMLTMCVAKPAEVGFCIYCCTQSLPTDTAHGRKIFPFLKVNTKKVKAKFLKEKVKRESENFCIFCCTQSLPTDTARPQDLPIFKSEHKKSERKNMKEKMKKGKVKTFALTAAYNLCQLTQHMAARSFHLQKKIKSNTDKNNTCDAERQ